MSIPPTRPRQHTPFTPTPLESLFPRDRPARRPVRWEGRPGEPTPLWALFGEEPPHGWRTGMALAPEDGGAPANDAPAPAPEPAPRDVAPEPAPGDGGSSGDGIWPGPFGGPSPFPAFDPAADPFEDTGQSIFPLKHVRGGHITPYTLDGLNGLAAQARQASEPGIYVTAHPAFGFGPDHTAVEHIAPDGTRTWIGGGPVFALVERVIQPFDLPHARLVTGVGSYDPATGTGLGDRSSDRPFNNVTAGRVVPPVGMTDAELFKNMRAVDASYSDWAPYHLFPEKVGQSNSNSVVPTLMDRTHSWSTFDFGGTVGGAQRIPPVYFPTTETPYPGPGIPGVKPNPWGAAPNGR